MTASEVVSYTWSSSAPGTVSPCQGSTCSFESYMWFALVMASCCPFVAFCCCCICNKWYLNSGPFAGLTDDHICPRGKRCTQPCRLFCFWCCPSVFPPPTFSTNDENVVSTAVTSATIVNVTRVPPPYDEALTMARPSDGEVVIFICDETICSFKYSKDDNCDPPAYKFLEQTGGSGSSSENRGVTVTGQDVEGN